MRPSPDALTALVEEDLDDHPRVRLSHRTPARTSPDGPAIGARPAGDWPYEATALQLVSSSDAQLRVLLPYRGSRLLLYIERAGLLPALGRSEWLRPAPERAELTTGVELGPGIALEVLETRGEWIRVSARLEQRAYSGWVPRDALAESYTRYQFSSDDGDNGEARPSTKLYRTPGKELVFQLEADDVVDVKILDRRGAWTLVNYVNRCASFSVRGWAPSRRVATPEPSLSLSGCGTGGDRSGLDERAELPKVAVKPGQILLDAPRGEVIGVTTKELELARGPDDTVYLESPWGPVPAVLAPTELRLI